MACECGYSFERGLWEPGSQAAPLGLGVFFMIVGALYGMISVAFVVAGQLPLKFAASSLLFLAYGMAIHKQKRSAPSAFWCLAALPVAVTPAGLVLLVATIASVVYLRKRRRYFQA